MVPLIPRRGLMARLREIHPTSVMSLTAPAGYGKSSLLRAWAQGTPGALVLLKATPELNDVDRLVEAVENAVRPLGARTSRPSRGAGNALTHVLGRRQLVLAIDDAHHLSDDAVLRLLGEHLLEDPLERLVVLSGRRPVPLDWTRLRMARRVVTVGPRELSLRVEDVMATSGMTVDAATVERLVHAGNGWPAAIKVALGAAQAEDSASAAPALGTQLTPRALLESYIRAQVLSEIPEEIVDFLMDAAVTGSLEGSALDSVRGIPADPVRASLRESPLPLMEVGADGSISMAPVLRDVLAQRAKSQAPERTAHLAVGAQALVTAKGDHGGRLRLALIHGDVDTVRAVLIEAGAALVLGGDAGLVEAALATLSPEILVDEPGLPTLRALVAGTLGLFEEARFWVGIAEARRPPETPRWSLAGSGPVDLMIKTFGLQDVDHVEPIRMEADVPMPWLGLQTVVHAFDLAARGQLPQATAILSAAVSFTTTQPLVEINRASVLAYFAHLQGQQGLEDEALADGERASRSIGGAEGPLGLLLQAQLARRELARGRADRAGLGLAECLQVVRSTPKVFRTPRFLAIAALVDVARGLGADADVAELLRTARPIANELIRTRGVPTSLIDQLLGSTSGGAPSLPAGDGNPTPRTAAGAESGVPKLTAAELRVLRQLNTPMPVPRISTHLGVAVGTVRAQIRSIYTKLGVDNRPDAVARALAVGIDFSAGETDRRTAASTRHTGSVGGPTQVR